jgi:alkanesulfonate monooxygenase SsuD/methylene tetrahydromethanopterin reductase-like flavin-dependent oxidoreductase (luciferase family)
MFNAPAAVLATQVGFIAAQAPGRFVLGLGSSTGNMVQRWYGVPFERPLRQLREYVQLLRQILAGGKTAFAGECINSHGFRSQSPPAQAVPLHLGAMGPRMLALAGELADGVMLNDFTPPDVLAEALDHLDTGAKRSGRRVEDLELVKRRAVVVTRNADEYAATREFYRQHFAFYASAPAYQAVMERLGYHHAVAEVRAANHQLIHTPTGRTLAFGAVAAAVHGYPRSTRDLDLAVHVLPSRLEEIASRLRDAGFVVELRMPDGRDPLGGVT